MKNVVSARLKLSAVLLASALIGGSMQAQDTTQYTPEFGAQVRQYLMDNPHVILEAVQGLEARRAEDALAEKLAGPFQTLVTTGPDMRIGATDAKTVIIEFFDYRCPICKAMVPVIESYVEAHPDVAVVKKHLPIISPGSERAARYVLAADGIYGTDVSRALHRILYQSNAPMREQVFAAAARELGLEHDRIQGMTDDHAITAIIDRNRDIAIELGITGTPVFMSERRMKIGVVTMDDLAALVAPAR